MNSDRPTEAEFLSQYLQAWNESPLDRQLRELAEEYHDRCEAFDRTRCRHRNERGVAVPADPWEAAEINRHASRVRKELGARAEWIGATPRQWHEAIVWTADRRA